MITDDQISAAMRAAVSGTPPPAPISVAAVQDQARQHRRNRVLAGLAVLVVATSVSVPIARHLELGSRLSPVDRPNPTPTSTLPTIPNASAPITSGRLLFTITTVTNWSTGEQAAVRVAYIDASGLHVIPVDAGANIWGAVWAGRDAIVFHAGTPPQTHIYTARLDGTAVHQITVGPDAQDRPAVSPDGATVVFGDASTSDGRDLGLHEVAIDGTGLRALTPAAGSGSPKHGDDAATFSPDGRRIAYVHVVDADKNITALWVMNADGTGAHRITMDGTSVDHPRWSPDGTKILYSSGEPSASTSQLWVVDAAGGKPRVVVPAANGDQAFAGTWSPDGSQVAYAYWKVGWQINELRIANADGSGVRTVWTSKDGLGAQVPDWRT